MSEDLEDKEKRRFRCDIAVSVKNIELVLKELTIMLTELSVNKVNGAKISSCTDTITTMLASHFGTLIHVYNINQEGRKKLRALITEMINDKFYSVCDMLDKENNH